VYALQSKLTLDQVLQDLETPIKSRALARISHHPVVQTHVQKYRDPNPHWALQIPVLLEKSKEKQKKTLKKLEKKEKLKSDGKSEQGIEESSSNPKTDSSGEDDDTSSVPVKPTTKKVKVKPPTTLDKIEGTIKVKVLKDLAELETESETRKRKLRSASAKPGVDAIGIESTPGDGIPTQKRPRSSFFVGGVDAPITSLKESSTVQKPRLPKGQYAEPKPVFRKGKLISKPNRAERRSEGRKQFDKPKTSYKSAVPQNRFPADSNSSK